ncbi:hypothetical protein COO09_16160 [Rhizorhabdus dicambivorans]|uniref:Uncharacterized protein n=2 Tax=Rhizorhabdus dicambivorans TaxID=1850238 RepID=A0A2A4FU05_9SPHN|nr:hypothetical protein COO09_16160 [Rhizorhabdus dicambivorans]
MTGEGGRGMSQPFDDLPDDFGKGFERLRAALASTDQRAGQILALHAAIEREMDIALRDLLPHATRLRGLGYSQKASVLAALTPYPDSMVTTWWLKPIERFNELRNGVAHGDSSDRVDAAIDRLKKSFDSFPPPSDRFDDVTIAAGLIFSGLGTAKLAPHMTKMAEQAARRRIGAATMILADADEN